MLSDKVTGPVRKFFENRILNGKKEEVPLYPTEDQLEKIDKLIGVLGNDRSEVMRAIMDNWIGNNVGKIPKTVRDRIRLMIKVRGGELELSDTTIQKAIRIFEELPSRSWQGRRPRTVGAGCLRLASMMKGEEVTQGMVASEFDITRKTLRDAVQEFSQHVGG